MVDRNKCCGCAVCANRCPKDAIKMTCDELGFLHPQIDEQKCIHCGLCESVCPIDAITDNKGVYQSCYAGFLDNVNQLMKSASGGAFYSLACGAIKNGYIVYGVRYSQDYKRAEYTRVIEKDDLELLRGSKYIQSEKGFIFRKIEQDLKEGRKVFFVGLPCDTAALLSFLRKPYPSLITVDLICYGCTTPMVADKYITWKEKQFRSSVSYMTIKDKSSGWENPSLYMEFENGKTYRKIFRNTEYGVAFNKIIRSSCYNCSFKGKNRWSDITVGDYWGVSTSEPIYNSKGVSLLLVNTEKGKKVLEWMEDFRIEKIDGTYARKCNVSIDRCQAPTDADAFKKAFLSKGLSATHDYKFWVRTMIPDQLLSTLKSICRRG